MPLNLHLLRVFATVVERRGFSAAAKALYISQPAVSKSVQEFEEQLGVVLIDRTRRNLTLTQAGMTLYEHAQRLFAVEQETEKSLEDLQGLEQGQLTIGASHTIGTYWLPPLLQLFHEMYPAIWLSVQIENTQRLIEELRTASLNIAFVDGSVEASDLIVVPWKTDRLVLITPPHHLLVGQGSVNIDDIVQFPYLQREEGSCTRQMVEMAFQERALQLNIAIELGSNQAVKQGVIAGLGISIVPGSTIELERKAGVLAVIEPVDLYLDQTLAQVTIKDRLHSPALAAFLATWASAQNPHD